MMHQRQENRILHLDLVLNRDLDACLNPNLCNSISDLRCNRNDNRNRPSPVAYTYALPFAPPHSMVIHPCVPGNYISSWDLILVLPVTRAPSPK